VTFGPNHYVPVLKIKLNEKQALQSVSSTLHSHITPLLEVVKRNPDKAATIDEHLNTTFLRLAESVRPYPRCFLDAREIAPDGQDAAVEVFQRAGNERIVFTPVTGLSRLADRAAALEHRANGLALRVTREEFERGGLLGRIEAFLTQHRLSPEEIDLIIDLGAAEDLIADGIAVLTDAFMTNVPHHQRWRTFTVSASAFPLGMGIVTRNSHELVKREEWIAWRDHLYARRRDLTRLPTYSDCAIQHPVGVEDFDFRIMAVSASIRYTLPEKWLLIKGESTRIVTPKVQFPRLATRLVYGNLRDHFASRDHCAGCLSIQMAADRAPKFGSAGVWRKLGTIHHISMVMQGLASLPWS
jgi:hypothetical protein